MHSSLSSSDHFELKVGLKRLKCLYPFSKIKSDFLFKSSINIIMGCSLVLFAKNKVFMQKIFS